MATPLGHQIRTRRRTRAEHDRLSLAGVLDEDEPIELLDGQLVPQREARPIPDARLLGVALHRLAVVAAYLGGAVVGAVGTMSAASIVRRTALGRPILGDFELVEMGIAVAGSLFLPYCQATRGHIIVDFFTMRAGARAVAALDRAGALLMAAMFLGVGWRTIVGGVDIAASGETSMLMRIPIWIGYAAMVPGVLLAGIIALAQAAGVEPLDRRG